jgi:hypothetical protein
MKSLEVADRIEAILSAHGTPYRASGFARGERCIFVTMECDVPDALTGEIALATGAASVTISHARGMSLVKLEGVSK